jgi:hypothetical protein
MSQFAALFETVTETMLAVVVVLPEEHELDVAVDEAVDELVAIFLPDFCCCSRCNRVVTPDVNESTMHCGCE